MRKILKTEVKEFIKESYNYIMDCESKNDLKMCVVCIPTFAIEGEFNGFKFGYMEQELAKDIIDLNEKNTMAVAISYKEALKIKIEIDEILEEYRSERYIKDGKEYVFKDDGALEFMYECDINGEKYEQIKEYSVTKEEAYNIWIEKKEKEFLERIKFIKENIFKI
ncbi:TPA: hypothetical protein ACF2DE_003352 [Clostridium perfringens]